MAIVRHDATAVHINAREHYLSRAHLTTPNPEVNHQDLTAPPAHRRFPNEGSYGGLQMEIYDDCGEVGHDYDETMDEHPTVATPFLGVLRGELIDPGASGDSGYGLQFG